MNQPERAAVRHAIQTSPSLRREAILRDLRWLAAKVPESVDPETGAVDMRWYAATRALRDRGRQISAEAIRQRLEAHGREHAGRRPAT